VPLTDPKDPGWSFSGDWSPDGLHIVYDHFRPNAGPVQLRVMDADGTNITTLWSAEGRGAEMPDWGP
jgi:Tol biopolymer transport system component